MGVIIHAPNWALAKGVTLFVGHRLAKSKPCFLTIDQWLATWVLTHQQGQLQVENASPEQRWFLLLGPLELESG